MRTEVLELKRACFCFPLRYSLIIWGYFRMIMTIVNLFRVIRLLIDRLSYFEAEFITYLFYFITTMGMVDIVLLIVFIIGAHKKSVKLLKIFYFYDLGVLIVKTLFNVAMNIRFAVLLKIQMIGPVFSGLELLGIASLEFVDLIIAAYVLLLVRSEIMKLQNNCQFRFMNNAAEAECTMTTTQTDNEERGLEDISNKGTFKSEESSYLNV